MLSSDRLPNTKKEKEAAFKQVFDRYYSPIRFYATKLIKDESFADDIADESFAKAWDHWDRLETHTHLRNFLYRVTYNRCLNFLRDDKSGKMTDLESIELAATDEYHEHLWNKELLHTRFLEKLSNALDSIPEGKVIRMSFLEGKSTKEIAAALGINENMVFIAKSRGLKKLREILKPEDWLFFLYFFLAVLN